jgi:predicted aspartyl protease
LEEIMGSLSQRIEPALSAALYSLLFFAFCNSVRADDASLKSLYDGHRWFDLRDAVAKGGAAVFYQGVVACVLNDLRRCEKEMAAVVNANPQSDEAVKAHKHLASAYLVHGKYREVLAQINAILAVRPGDSDAANDRSLMATLAEFPDQEVAHRANSTLDMQEAGLPFAINGVQATYWFDTGANYSVMTESEARRFGLKAREVSTKMGVSTGAKVDFQVAVADEVSFGSFRLRHVAFLVVRDDQPPFNENPDGSRGLIGMPVLMAFQRFAWANRKFEIGTKPLGKNVPRAKLCFDENDPVTEIRFENRTLTFVLDTGATNTDLFPPFAAAFPELISKATRTDSYKTEGVGSVKYINAAILPSVRFSIGGFPVTLNNADVLLKSTNEKSNFFAGNLGIDLLQQAHKTTFDLKEMTLALQ